MQSSLDILQYINAIYRYRLVAVCTLFVGVTLTVVTVRSLPNVYASTTLIMVEPQDIPEAYVKATVTEQLEKRLQAMNQEVLSRTRLEAIINDFELYGDLKESGMPMELIVDYMRRKVALRIFPVDNAFRITYEGTQPSTVQRVTARLAALYIDENLRIREARATGTTDFMESEMEKARRHLEELEGKVQAFKREHMGELPEQQGANMQMLEAYQSQLQSVTMNLSRAMERKMLLEREATESRSVQGQPGQPATVLASPAQRLQQLQSQLHELRGRYTTEHPDVRNIERQIEALQDEIVGGGEDGEGRRFVSPGLTTARMEAQLEISRLREEEARISKLIEVYREKVEKAFVREQQLEALTRDYDVTRRKYETLLDKKLEAQLSQSLEQRQKAERFRIIDPASRPEAPSRPNRQLLVAGGAVASLALALLIPCLLWQLDSSFHVAEEFAALSVPVLAVIPELSTADVDRRRWRYRTRVLSASAACLVAGLGLVSFYAKYLF